MKKVQFGDDIFIWRDKLNLVNWKKDLLKEAYDVINSQSDVTTDGFAFKREIKDLDFMGKINIQSKLDEILQIGINECKKLYENDIEKPYNKINLDCWVNIVRSKNPVQIHFKHQEIKGVDKYHTHTDLNRNLKLFLPNYTFVYYIQMPDVMEGEDGVLYFKSKDETEYYIRPEEDDFVIMPGDMPHAPNSAPKATIDRIVLAGNVGFDYIKKEKTFL